MSGAETEVEEEEDEIEEEEGRDGDTPRGAPVEVIRMGGKCLPQRKTRITGTLPRILRTCC